MESGSDRVVNKVRVRQIPAQRKQEILREVYAGTSGVAELAAKFGVSEMTVRRDLGELARAGKLQRVRGGAIGVPNEPPFAETAIERIGAKDRIGTAAAELIEEGTTVMIDIGTTTLQLARKLHGRRITVITTSLAVFEELYRDPAITMILPGGIVRRNYLSLVGPITKSSLSQLRADIMFLGTSGVDYDLAVWDSTMIEVPVKRAMIDASRSVVLLADCAKFGGDGLVRVCNGVELDRVVTDVPLGAAYQEAISSAGLAVTVA